MSKVLLIGNGAREHALAKQLVKSGVEIHSLMDKLNPGIKNLSKEYYIGSLTNLQLIKNIKSVDFAVIGPENPLTEGIVDTLWQKYEVPAIGPNKEGAKLEGSKVYTREIVSKAIAEANPKYFICKNKQELEQALEELDNSVAIKPETLTGGKGVKLSGSHLHSKNDIIDYCSNWIKKDGRVLVEELLKGQEFTLQAFCDGKHLEFMPLVKDYKRAFDGDLGPNTGSMGAVTCSNHGLPYLSESSLHEAKTIMIKTINYMQKHQGIVFKGILYGQFMLTDENKVKLIEYNVRFGDPEAMNVLSLLQTDFQKICYDILNGTLKSVNFKKEASICVYIVPNGYPEHPIKDGKIDIPQKLENDIYFASVYAKEGEQNTVYTTGSRAIGVLAQAKDINTAHMLAMEKIVQFKGPIAYRNDIGYDIKC